MGGDLAAARVQGHGQAFRAPAGHEGGHEVGIIDDGCTEHDPRRAQVQGTRGIVQAADAAAELDSHAQPGQPGEDRQGLVGGLERAVQVDDVQPVRPGRLPAAAGLDRIGAVGGLARGIALPEPDDLPAAQIDGGVNGEGGCR